MLRMMQSLRLIRSMATAKHANWAPHTYYDILGVSSTATPQEIKKAYTKLIEVYHPDASSKGDTNKFQKINEAYVILSNDSSKRAYDLVSEQSKGKTFIREPRQKPQVEKSDYAKQLEQKNEQKRKELNIDHFGRYRGGLPRPKSGLLRGNSFNRPGVYQDKFQEEYDVQADYQYVDAEKAESFKNFHQSQRQYRTTKWTWIKAEVDYEFFKPFKRFAPYRNSIKASILLFFVIPFILAKISSWIAKNKQQAIRKKNHLPTIAEYKAQTFNM